MTSEINPNKNIINQNWNSHLEKGAYKGRKIEKMAKALMGKDASDITYNDNGTSISYGKHILDLGQLASSKDSSLSFSYLKHKIKLKVSSDYKKTHQAEISNFAKLINEKLKVKTQDGAPLEKLPLPDIPVQKNPTVPLPDIPVQKNPTIIQESPVFNAIRLRDVDEIKNLIKQGVNLNIEDNEGKTPLTHAIESFQLDIIKELIQADCDIHAEDKLGYNALMHSCGSPEITLLLLEAGADPHSINDQGQTPLMLARNHVVIDHLVKKGADVNHQDFSGNTALILSSQKGLFKESIVEHLLLAGADVNLVNDKGVDALVNWVFIGQNDVVKTLIEHGASLDRNWQGRSMLDLTKELQSRGYKEIVTMMKEKNPKLHTRHAEFKYRQRIAHAWHLDGESNLVNKNDVQNTKMEVEGSFAEVSYNLMQKNIREYEQYYPKLTNQNELEKAFKIASLQNLNNVADFMTNIEILNNIQAENPTFINTGYHGHAVTVLIWKDQLVICNRGGQSRMPIEVYHYDSSLLDYSIIDSLRRVNQGTAEDYDRLLHTDLEEKIKLSQSPLDLYLQNAKTLPDQIVGNCSWISPVTGVYAFLLLSAASGKEANNPVLKESIKKEVKSYRTWIGFEQIATLEKMMKVVGTTGYEPDYKLIEDALERAYSFHLDDVLSEKLKALTSTYVKAIPEDKAVAFNQKLSDWQTKSKIKIPL